MLVELLFGGISLFNGAGKICDGRSSYKSTKKGAKDAEGYFHISLPLPATCILELYCQRSAIENTFSVLKNQIGGLAYHFWSKLIEKSSRRPKKNKAKHSTAENAPEEIIRNKVRAIEKFVNLSAILVGILQILALSYPEEIWRNNTRWLRTYSNVIPSEYIVRVCLFKKFY